MREKHFLKGCIKMMDFVLMTLSFTIAILLASALSCVFVMNGKVIKFIVKWYIKRLKSLENEFEEMF